MQKLKTLRLHLPIALLAFVFLLSVGIVSLAAERKASPRAAANTAAYTVGAGSTAAYTAEDGYCAAGVQVWLSKGDTFTLNTVLDLNAWDKDDSLFEAFATPSKIGTADYRRLFFTLTDVEDPSATVTVQYRGWTEQNYSVVSACASGQRYTSLQWWDKTVWIGKNSWHAMSCHTFTGQMHTDSGVVATPADAPARVWYDSETNVISYDIDYENNRKQWIIDLDDPAYFDTLFTGFPSGRVRLSIQADEYVNDRAGFRLTKFGDVDLSATTVSDSTAPVITVDTPWTDAVPYAKAGCSFPVPNATANDAQFGVCDVTSKVEYSVASDGTRTTVPVQNGRFSTANAGYYFITYSATDPLGNTATVPVTVQTGDVPAPSITVDTMQDTATTGTLVSVRSASVAPNAETTTLTVKATLDSEEIAIENGKFRPMKSGNWTVTYTATDICGQTDAKSYTLQVAASATPVFTTEPQLPKRMISGGRYFLPRAEATSFASGSAQTVAATVKVEDAAGERTIAPDEVYIPRVENNRDTVKIIYEAGGGTWEKEVECILPYVAEGRRMRLRIENYFTLNDVDFAKTDYNTVIAATDADGSLTFDRELLLENLTVGFASIPERSQFHAIYVTLKDASDESRKVSCRFERDAGTGGTMFVSGSTRIGITSMFVPYTAPTTVALSFIKGAWNFGGNWSLSVLNWDDGTPFDGFRSEYVYLEMGFTGATAGAAFTLSDINGQPISANPYDNTAPYISMQGDFGGSVRVGETVTVNEASAVDVLDPMARVSVTVRKPNGETATSVDGVLLDHAACTQKYGFVAEEYGDYLVSYTAVDAFGGNTMTFNYVVGVFDEDAPVIAVKGTPASVGKVGEAFVLPSLQVSDNVSAAENIVVSRCVFTPKGVMTYIGTNSNAFVPTYAGEYTVFVTAYDEAGNVATYTHKITVK